MELFSAEEELEFTPPHFLGQGSSFPNFQRNVVGMNFETPATFCTNNPEEAEMGLDRMPASQQLLLFQERTRISKDVQKSKKNVRSNKGQKLNSNVKDEESTTGLDRQSSSSYSYQVEKASQKSNGGETSDHKTSSSALNFHGKARTSRGSN
ncbi:unnamed protein product [Prunus armeniaca]